jgi:hypothetical protein
MYAALVARSLGVPLNLEPPQNYPSQLSGAIARVAIAVRLLEVQNQRRGYARLQEDRLQLNRGRYAHPTLVGLTCLSVTFHIGASGFSPASSWRARSVWWRRRPPPPSALASA